MLAGMLKIRMTAEELLQAVEDVAGWANGDRARLVMRLVAEVFRLRAKLRYSSKPAPPPAPSARRSGLVDELDAVFEAADEMVGAGDPDTFEEKRTKLLALHVEVLELLGVPKYQRG